MVERTMASQKPSRRTGSRNALSEVHFPEPAKRISSVPNPGMVGKIWAMGSLCRWDPNLLLFRKDRPNPIQDPENMEQEQDNEEELADLRLSKQVLLIPSTSQLLLFFQAS